MTDGPIFIGMDPANGRDFTVVMRMIERGVFEVLSVPPDMLATRSSTADEILAKYAAGERMLIDLARGHGKTSAARAWARLVFPMPRRRKWDQYGAYYRRQLKKWSKRPFRLLGAVSRRHARER